jgi:hypothetical protein
MAQQQGLPKTAQKVNLAAIQNLNSYVDGVQQFLKTGKYPFPWSQNNHMIEIEFVMAFRSARGNNHHPSVTLSTSTTAGSSSSGQPITTSRRKVELQVPPPTMSLSMVERHVQHQIVKLLRISDLPVPASLPAVADVSLEEDGIANADDHDASSPGRRRRVMTPWEASRYRFWNRIHWKKFDRLYQQALQDAQAHIMTRHKIRNTPKLRHKLLAKILSNVQFQDNVLPLERLVAYRRLLRLLDDHFDELHLEDYGKYWEDQLTMVVTESRPYNTSSSAMRKRRQRNMETGYSFTIHHDNQVTVTIPIDFSNAELLQELTRNIMDFVEWTSNQELGGGGLEGMFASLMHDNT